MSWFSRRKPQGEFPPEVGVTDGAHRSPGVAALSEEMSKRRVESILDLGGSHNENLAYLGQYCGNIVIHDVMGASGEPSAAPRASLFQVDEKALALAAQTRFDVVLLWDLLHYVERSQVEPFVARLGELARPEALVLLLASGSTPIPLTPIRFKIRDSDHLHYEVTTDRRGPAPRFTPRQVERMMNGFRPLRFFQLRNGLQEFLFRYEPPVEKTETAGGSTAGEMDPARL